MWRMRTCATLSNRPVNHAARRALWCGPLTFWYFIKFYCHYFYCITHLRNPTKLNTRSILHHCVFMLWKIYKFSTVAKYDSTRCGRRCHVGFRIWSAGSFRVRWACYTRWRLFLCGLFYDTISDEDYIELRGEKKSRTIAKNQSWPNRACDWKNWRKPQQTIFRISHDAAVFESTLREIDVQIVTATPNAWVKIVACRSSNPAPVRHALRNDR